MKTLKIFILLNILFLHNAQSQIFVNASATGSGNGSSWVNAYPNLQNAITAATSGQEIWVQTGIYYPSLDRNGVIPANPRNATFVLKEGVKLYGGFAGTETILSERNPEANVTVLSGDIGVGNDDTDNIYTLLLCVDLTSSSRIDGFTVTKANNNRPSGNVTIASYVVNQNSGGAGWILSSDIVITNNKFIGNKSGSVAGGLFIRYGSIQTFVNNVFTANESVNQAGAIYSIDSSISFENCIFSDNIAGAGAAAYIYNNGVSSGNISNCTFTNNKSKADGGALLFYASDPLVRNEITITDCSFDKNSCFIPNGVLNGLGVIATRGGAIYADRTNLSISRCSFTNHTIKFLNSGSASGGAISLGNDTATKIDKCNFINNSALPYISGNSASGGAIDVSSEIEISNCVFAGNHSAGSGGAIELTTTGSTKNKIAVANCVFTQNTANLNAGAIYYGTALPSYPTGFTNLTFYANSAQLQGGALYFSSFSQLQQTTQLQNCIFEGNSPNEIAYYSTFKSTNLLASNNRYQTDNFSGSLFNDATNLIGKDGVWGTVDDGLRINVCSLVVDAGINTGLILPGTQNLWIQGDLDITGNKRIRGSQLDLGAYESDANASPILTSPLPSIVVNAGEIQKVINLDNYFSIAAGSTNSYAITSVNPESGLYQAIIADSMLKISFHETLTGSGQISVSALNACGLVSNETINITVNSNLSTEDMHIDGSLFLYPNPAGDILMVSGSNPIYSYKIINVLGQTIQNSLFDSRKVNVKDLASGVYYIIINSNDKFYRLKFYKK